MEHPDAIEVSLWRTDADGRWKVDIVCEDHQALPMELIETMIAQALLDADHHLDLRGIADIRIK